MAKRNRRPKVPAILSKSEEAERLAELERTYMQLFEKRTVILDASTSEQRPRFLEEYAAARTALTKAVADGIANNDPVVLRYHEELVRVNDKIEAHLKDLKDVSGFLNLVSEAVKLSLAIVALGA